jgi:hypothetical protein
MKNRREFLKLLGLGVISSPLLSIPNANAMASVIQGSGRNPTETINTSFLDLEKDFGVVANGTDQREKLVNAIQEASIQQKRLYFPGYKNPVFIDNSRKGAITIPNLANWFGQNGSLHSGSRIKFKGPGFTNAKNSYLSGVKIEDICFIGSDINDVTKSVSGSNHCFELFTITNNSVFKRVYIQWFNGDGFRLRKQKKNTGDKTVVGNVIFEQTFILSCGGYAYDVNGYPTGLWLHNDINSCIKGAYHFADGVSNQCNVNIIGLWWEGNRAWTSKQPILIENGRNMPINLHGCNFSGHPKGTDVIKITGASSANINLIGCAGYSYKNWINDTVTKTTIPWTSQGYINKLAGIS